MLSEPNTNENSVLAEIRVCCMFYITLKIMYFEDVALNASSFKLHFWQEVTENV